MRYIYASKTRYTGSGQNSMHEAEPSSQASQANQVMRKGFAIGSFQVGLLWGGLCGYLILVLLPVLKRRKGERSKVIVANGDPGEENSHSQFRTDGTKENGFLSSRSNKLLLVNIPSEPLSPLRQVEDDAKGFSVSPWSNYWKLGRLDSASQVRYPTGFMVCYNACLCSRPRLPSSTRCKENAMQRVKTFFFRLSMMNMTSPSGVGDPVLWFSHGGAFFLGRFLSAPHLPLPLPCEFLCLLSSARRARHQTHRFNTTKRKRDRNSTLSDDVAST